MRSSPGADASAGASARGSGNAKARSAPTGSCSCWCARNGTWPSACCMPPRTACRCAASSISSTRPRAPCRIWAASNGRWRNAIATGGRSCGCFFDYYDTDRLMICLDPANIDLMRDFMSDRANARILELQCVFDDQYLVGHARRVGLATERTPDEVIQRMLPHAAPRVRRPERAHPRGGVPASLAAEGGSRAGGKTPQCSATTSMWMPRRAMPWPRRPIFLPTEGGRFHGLCV